MECLSLFKMPLHTAYYRILRSEHGAVELCCARCRRRREITLHHTCHVPYGALCVLHFHVNRQGLLGLWSPVRKTSSVELKDRVGLSHPLIADAGCLNTVFNARAQSGSEHAHTINPGCRSFRIEFLRETPDEVASILAAYTDSWRGVEAGRRSGKT